MKQRAKWDKNNNLRRKKKTCKIGVALCQTKENIDRI